MAYTISISDQPNNSLGDCWLCKFEDDFTGELYDKCLYPKADCTADEALRAFIADHVRDDEVDVEEIFLLDSAKDDIDAATFAELYKVRWGVEYRNMHTAIHGLFAFETEQEAEDLSSILVEAENDPDGPWMGDAEERMDGATAHFEEIDFRDVDDHELPTGEIVRFFDDGAHGVVVVNGIAYDLYI